MRGPVALILLLAAATLVIASPSNPLNEGAPGEAEARAAAEIFGNALVHSELSRLRSILPARGKVRLRVGSFTPDDGSYGRQQVEALLGDFLREGALRTFAVLHVEAAPGRYALVHARSRAVDRGGRAVELDLHLTFEPEDARWVLRELRETPP